LGGISDSEYAWDPDTQISVYCYILYFFGAPISWKSKAEYFGTSEIAYEDIFGKNLLDEIGIQLDFTYIIKRDNLGATYLANIACKNQRTENG
jgi:hypothetical protein